ncbi:MAG: hypothetical protein K2Y37_14780 [Pirellulales bacterium]|nr:hypothetical protein [Pirellulales bacterium]
MTATERSGAVLFAKIDIAASGNIVAATAAKKIRVLSYALIAATAVTAKWQSATTPTDHSGAMSLPATGGLVCNHNPAGWFDTNAGEALKLTLGASIQVSGHLSYQLIA